MPNVLTDIREAVETAFAPMASESVVARLLTYDVAHAINFSDPTLNIRKWLVVLPAGGPSDPHYSSARVKLTRKFFVGFNVPVENMDVTLLETVELAAIGCIQDADAAVRAVSAAILDVRWKTGEYQLYQKNKEKMDTGGPAMWTSFATVEVDVVVLKSEVASWKPT